MTPEQRQERINTIIEQLVNHGVDSQDMPFEIVAKLRRDAITLRRLFECECNGCTRDPLKYESLENYDQARERQMEWVEKRIEQVKKRIARICKGLELTHFIQSDPRGCSLYLGTDSKENYHQEGVAIY